MSDAATENGALDGGIIFARNKLFFAFSFYM